MNRLYEMISGLREEKGITDAELARRAKIRPGLLSDLKHNDNQMLKYENLKKIADFFNVPVSFFDSGIIDPSDIPPEPPVSKHQILFALFGDVADDITDEEYEEVQRYCGMVRLRKLEEKRRKANESD